MNATDKTQMDVEQLDALINELELFGVVINHPDRPLRFGTFPAEDSETAIESALVVFEICERLVADERHIVTVVPFGLGGDMEAVERDSRWGDMMSRHTNGKRMDPKKSIDQLME